MKRNYNKQDKIKWIVTSVAFVLAFVMIAGIFMQVFAKDEKYKPASWFEKLLCDHDYGEGEKCLKCGKEKSAKKDTSGLIVTPNNEASRMSLRVASAQVSSTTASSYTITATVLPESATIQTVSFSFVFKNPQSTWANGKSVDTYIGKSQEGNILTVTCKEPFGEQIIVNAVADGAQNVKASATLDYLKRVESATISAKTGKLYEGCDIEPQDLIETVVLGVGTVEGEFSWGNKCKLILSDYSFSRYTDSSYWREFSDAVFADNITYFSDPNYVAFDDLTQSIEEDFYYNSNEDMYDKTCFNLSAYHFAINENSGFYRFKKSQTIEKFARFFYLAFRDSYITLEVPWVYSYNGKTFTGKSVTSSIFNLNDLVTLATGVNLTDSNFVF